MLSYQAGHGTEVKSRPLIAHLIHRLSIGGLENGVVNLINHLPSEKYRQAVICLTDYDAFRERIKPGVQVFALHKREGKDLGAYLRLCRVLRSLRPQILHTRTQAAFDAQLYAFLVGIPVRIHSEHGQISSGVGNVSITHRLQRQILRPLVHHYVTVNDDLATYLKEQLGIPATRVTRIYNGVDTERFHPRTLKMRSIGPTGFANNESFVIGSVGRIEPVKDYPTLVRAFLHLLKTRPAAKLHLRLVLIGDGPMREQCRKMLEEGGAMEFAWLPGKRSDIPELMRGMDVFVLPSQSEGTSNTILEAMATGLPIVATSVAGNEELVTPGITGLLTSPGDWSAMADAIGMYWQTPSIADEHGQAALRTVALRFALKSMMDGYASVYDNALRRLLKQPAVEGLRDSTVEN